MTVPRASYRQTLNRSIDTLNMFENNLITTENEILKAIPGYPGYLASNQGRVYSLKNNRFLAIEHRAKYDYICLSVNGNAKNRRLNRIIALAFCPKTEEQNEVHHQDTNSRNNKPNNLMWVTPHQHKAIHRELKKELKANKDRAKAGDTK